MADKSKTAAAAAAKPATPTRAYVTLLANDDGADDCFKGVVRLAEGLRSAGSAYPLVVAVLPDVPESRRRVLVDELGCVVREVQPVFPPHYNKLRVWELVEYDEMMYLDAAGFQGSLENIHEQFEPNGGPPLGPYVDADMFVFKPSVATARLLLHGVGVLMTMRLRTTISDLVIMRPGTTDDYHDDMMAPPTTTAVADHQQAAASSSSQQFSNNNGLTTFQLVMVFIIAAVSVVNIYLHL